MLSIPCSRTQYDLHAYHLCVLFHIQVYQLTLKKKKNNKHKAYKDTIS